jgi:hypothetical protein
MNLHTDPPTQAQLAALLVAREPASVSIYLSTPSSSRGEAARIELGEFSRSRPLVGRCCGPRL